MKLSKTTVLDILAVGFCLTVVLARFFYSPDVIVIDSAGDPIAGASVLPIMPSFDGAVTYTNMKGMAILDTGVFESQWVEINCKGYHSSGHVLIPDERPIIITLRKAEELH